MQESRGAPAKKPAPDYFLWNMVQKALVLSFKYAWCDRQDNMHLHHEEWPHWYQKNQWIGFSMMGSLEWPRRIGLLGSWWVCLVFLAHIYHLLMFICNNSVYYIICCATESLNIEPLICYPQREKGSHKGRNLFSFLLEIWTQKIGLWILKEIIGSIMKKVFKLGYDSLEQ